MLKSLIQKKSFLTALAFVLFLGWMGAEAKGKEEEGLVSQLGRIFKGIRSGLEALEQRATQSEQKIAAAKAESAAAKAESAAAKAESAAAKRRIESMKRLLDTQIKRWEVQEEAFRSYRQRFRCVEDQLAFVQRWEKEEQAERSKRRGGEQRTIRVAGVDFKIRWIPPGAFDMGSSDDENEKEKKEQPQHRVSITRGFWLMETEVTQEQYKAIMGQNPSAFNTCGESCPVESISWHDAAQFANKLSQKDPFFSLCESKQIGCFVCHGNECEGVGNKTTDYVGCKGWRLPTEAEWEYAARAGTTSPRYGEVEAIAWFNNKSPSPAWQKASNNWGLYDMLGNVWEWVYDRSDGSDYSHRRGGATDPIQVAAGSYRIARGGAWKYDAWYARAANRLPVTSSKQYDDFGFRLVRSNP